MSRRYVFILTGTTQPVYNLSVVTKRRSKRYRPGEQLLAQVVAIAQAHAVTAMDMAAFLADLSLSSDVVGAVALGDSAREVRSWAQKKIEQWQREVTDFLRQVIALRQTLSAAAERRQMQRLVDEMESLPTVALHRMRLAPIAVGRSVLLTVDGDARDVLWFLIVGLLRAVGVSRIQQCECNRLFLKTGRREFCSERCQKRVYMRKIRKLEKGERHGKTTRKR